MPTTIDKPKRRRRFLRWSMRTMFVGLTVVCVLFGLVYLLIVNPAEEQRKAVEALWELERVRVLYDLDVGPSEGGFIREIHRANELPVSPVWLSELIGHDYLANVTMVVFVGGRIHNDDLRHLQHFSKLKSLCLRNCDSITEDGIEQVTKLTSLTDLSLNCSLVTALPPEIGKLTNLTHLWLHGDHITDADLEILKSMKSLKVVRLGYTSVTAEGVAGLQQALPHCEIWKYADE